MEDSGQQNALLNNTTIIDGIGDEAQIKGRCETNSSANRRINFWLRQRKTQNDVAKLAGGVL